MELERTGMKCGCGLYTLGRVHRCRFSQKPFPCDQIADGMIKSSLFAPLSVWSVKRYCHASQVILSWTVMTSSGYTCNPFFCRPNSGVLCRSSRKRSDVTYSAQVSPNGDLFPRNASPITKKEVLRNVRRPFSCLAASSSSSTGSTEVDSLKTASSSGRSSDPEVLTGTWHWRGYHIRYQFSGENGPSLVLIHGFGANSDHWRKNISFLAKSHKVFSIDLIGYGYSDKPNPRQFGENTFYTFDTWGSQLNDFCEEVVKDDVFYVCNSIGGIVGLQAAVMAPNRCRGVIVLNISLRMLHIKKLPWYARPFVKLLQDILRNTDVGRLFYNLVATPQSVKSILSQCYYDSSKVSDELVQLILQPGLQPGAVDVFLEFICYSSGPLPEELLPLVKCPVLVVWGDKDPWEPIELGRAYADFETVEDFIVLPDVGHCPQDEAPNLVNPLVESFVARHSSCRS